MSHYLRAAWTPIISGWDLGGGVQWWGGTSSLGTPSTVYKTHAWAIDAQAQGMVRSMPLGVYVTYASAEKSNGTVNNLFNSNPNAKTAWAILTELGVLPGRATVALAYRSGDSGASSNNGDNALTIGGTYQLAQNAQLQINHTSYSGSKYDISQNNGDQMTTFMLFAAF